MFSCKPPLFRVSGTYENTLWQYMYSLSLCPQNQNPEVLPCLRSVHWTTIIQKLDKRSLATFIEALIPWINPDTIVLPSKGAGKEKRQNAAPLQARAATGKVFTCLYVKANGSIRWTATQVDCANKSNLGILNQKETNQSWTSMIQRKGRKNWWDSYPI